MWSSGLSLSAYIRSNTYRAKLRLAKGASRLTCSFMAKKSNEGRGPSQRQLRVGELIRRALSEILLRGDVHDTELSRMSITVGEVRVSADLKIATCYVLPLGGEGKEGILKLLGKNKYDLRHTITKKLALKHSPELRFQLDDTFDQMDATRKMLAQADVARDIAKVDVDETDTPA
jgi:ribosome-binding factor A